MAVDVLRSCYRSQMRFDPARPDLTVEVEWFYCPPGAKIFPYPTAFGSRNYTEVREYADLSLGEVEITQRYAKGLTPGSLTGQRFCGNVAAFASGVDLVNGPTVGLDCSGLPACCYAPGPPEDDLQLEDDTCYCLEDETGCILLEM